eukprot:4578471-Pleurochrysis_carterae.AAC.1
MQNTLDSQLVSSQPVPVQPVSSMLAGAPASLQPALATLISEPAAKARKGRGTALTVAQKPFTKSELEWKKTTEKLRAMEQEAPTLPGVAKPAQQKVHAAMQGLERSLSKMQDKAAALKLADSRAKERADQEAKKLAKQHQMDNIIIDVDGVAASDAA